MIRRFQNQPDTIEAIDEFQWLSLKFYTKKEDYHRIYNFYTTYVSSSTRICRRCSSSMNEAHRIIKKLWEQEGASYLERKKQLQIEDAQRKVDEYREDLDEDDKNPYTDDNLWMEFLKRKK